MLLKNDKQILPLRKSGTIAVIGPLANSKGDMLGTWAMGGDPAKISTIVDGLKNIGGKAVNILYARGSELTDNPQLAKSTNPLGMQGQQASKKPAVSADQLA